MRLPPRAAGWSVLAIAFSAVLAGSGCSSAPLAPEQQGSAASAPDGCAPSREGAGRQAPQLLSVEPAQGSAIGGTRINLVGSGFMTGARVQIGDTACLGIEVTSTRSISCTTAAHPAGQAEVLVMNPDRQCALNHQGFRFLHNVGISPRSKVVAVGNHFQFSVADGKPPYKFAIVSGPGTVDEASGEFTAGDAPGSVIVRATDASGSTSDAMVTVNPALSIALSEEAKAEGKIRFEVTGGAPPVTYSTSIGAPEGTVEFPSVEGATAETPPGESPPASPATPTNQTVVTVRDSMGNTAQVTLELNQAVPLSVQPVMTQALPGARISFVAGGGKPPYAYSVEGRGIVDSASGVYTAPDEPGTEVIKVVDQTGTTVSAQVTVNPVAPPRLGAVPSSATETGSIVSGGSSDGSAGGGSAHGSAGGGGFTQLALGFGHSCALKDGSALCWGDNRMGQLGNGTLVDVHRPHPVSKLPKDIIWLTAGYSHTCALSSKGVARCWGDNRYGQLGDGSDMNAVLPSPVHGLVNGVQSISAGQYHTCAVMRGAAYCWGSNRRGQLGNSSLRPSGLPVAVKGLGEGVVTVASGAAHSCALTDKGAVKCWGYNYSGQLGDGTVQDRVTPVEVRGLESGVQAIFAGGYHTCAVGAEGKLLCWGNNGLGQLGTASTKTELIPTEVHEIRGTIRAVATGYFHTCAWTGETAKCWGYNRDGQLGDATQEARRMVPTAVARLPSGLSGIAAGVNHSCALVSQGIRCWGNNDLGQFGNRSIAGSSIPVPTAPVQE